MVIVCRSIHTGATSVLVAWCAGMGGRAYGLTMLWSRIKGTTKVSSLDVALTRPGPDPGRVLSEPSAEPGITGLDVVEVLALRSCDRVPCRSGADAVLGTWSLVVAVFGSICAKNGVANPVSLRTCGEGAIVVEGEVRT